MIELNTPRPDEPVGDAVFQRAEQPVQVPIAEPRAQLIAWTEFQAPDDVPWSTDASGGQALAEFAGRACYQSWKKPNPATATNAGYLMHILEVGHLSVLEHGSVSFYFTGVSRSFTHELIRHRHFSYSQLSQRYVPERDAAMVEPDVIAQDPELHQKFVEAAAASVQAYTELLEGLEARFAAEDAKVHRPGSDPAGTCTACGLRWPCPDVRVPQPHGPKFIPRPGDLLDGGSVVRGREVCAYDGELWPCSAVPRPPETNATLRKKAARQAARAVLPNATETRIVVTGNYRAWRHFIKMRATEHADVEIRELAVECLRELQGVAPNVFGDFVITALPDGTEVAATEFAE